MTSHPGSGLPEAVELAEFAAELDFCPEQAQDFIPTPEFDKSHDAVGFLQHILSEYVHPERGGGGVAGGRLPVCFDGGGISETEGLHVSGVEFVKGLLLSQTVRRVLYLSRYPSNGDDLGEVYQNSNSFLWERDIHIVIIPQYISISSLYIL